MGSNRRYADHLDRIGAEREGARVVASGEPDTLRPQELELETETLVRADRAVPVTAWVRYGNIPIYVKAEAVAWTDRAVAIPLEALQAAGYLHPSDSEGNGHSAIVGPGFWTERELLLELLRRLDERESIGSIADERRRTDEAVEEALRRREKRPMDDA